MLATLPLIIWLESDGFQKHRSWNAVFSQGETFFKICDYNEMHKTNKLNKPGFPDH